MGLTRRELLRRGAEVGGALLLADVLQIPRALAQTIPAQVSPLVLPAPYAYRSQWDGSYCCAHNCGPAAAAMLRSTISNHVHNPSSASVRIWYNYQVYSGSQWCTGDTNHQCGNPAYMVYPQCPRNCCTSPCNSCYCPGDQVYPGHAGTDPYYLYQALRHPADNPNDVYHVALYDGSYSGYSYRTWQQFQADMDPATGNHCAVLNGQPDPDLANCDPSGSTLGHSVFVLYRDVATGRFYVYNPDNWNGCTQASGEWWSASTTMNFAGGYAGSGYVSCIEGWP